jgi:hypothetical protein
MKDEETITRRRALENSASASLAEATPTSVGSGKQFQARRL